MGWGAPLGFSSGKSPFELANTAGFGEPGWYCRFRPKPTPEHPLRARLTSPCSFSTFDSPADARQYIDHPGDTKEHARRYLAWALDGIDPMQEQEDA